MTALGAAVAAGVGAGVWRLGEPGKKEVKVFTPSIGEEEREKKMETWRMAIERCLGWEKN